jgi:hypothetical protein
MSTLRNEVDLISNAVSMDWQPRGTPPYSIQSELSFHTGDLPHFFHEITHWQCFQAVVGHSFRTLWDVLVSATKNSAVRESTIQNRSIPPQLDRLLHSFKIGWTVYEALVEGVALFAQWDATPGEAASCSKGALYLHSFLLLPQFMQNKEAPSLGTIDLSKIAWQRLTSELADGRMSSSSRTSKVDLLAETTTGPRGHYLVGYLFIKRLYLDAIRHHPRFADSDFFLAFVNACFFQDPIAGQLLLSLDDDPADVANNLIRRIAERADLFRSEKVCELAEKYEQEHGGDSPTRSGGTVDVDMVEWDRWSKSEARLRTVFPNDTTTSFNSTDQLIVHTLNLTHRRLLRIRHLVGTAREESDHVALLDSEGNELLRCDKVKNDLKGIYPNAIYTLYHDPQSHCFYRSIVSMVPSRAPTLGSEYYTMQPLSPEYRELIEAAVLTGLRHEWNRDKPGGMDDVIKIFDRCLHENDIRTAKYATNASLLRLAFQATKETSDNIYASLEREGAFGMLNGSAQVYRSVAALSIFSASGVDTGLLRTMMSDEPFGWDDLREILDDARNRWGVELYNVVRDNSSKERVVCGF